MPIYEYECSTCGHRFEKLVRIGAEPPPCPECAGAVQKRISAAGFILKGGGWYKDHYGLKPDSGGGDKGDSKSSESKPAESKSESKSSESKPAESKSESKSEAKPSARPTPPPAAK